MNQLIRSNGRLGWGLCITGIIAVLHVSLDGCVTADSKSNSHDNLGTRIERYTLGYVYYFSNTLLSKGIMNSSTALIVRDDLASNFTTAIVGGVNVSIRQARHYIQELLRG